MPHAHNVIISAPLVPSLTRWGVSAHADLVYRALATLGRKAPLELAVSLDLPVRRVQLALDELHGLDAARTVHETADPAARIWQCRQPEQVVTALRRRQEMLVKARYHLQRNLSLLDICGFAPEDLHGVRLFNQQPARQARLQELLAAERSEHLAMSPEPAISVTTAKAAMPAARAMLQRGIQTWTLGVPAAEDDESGQVTDELLAYGLEYRELPQQPTKLMIMDRKTALVPLDPSRNFSGGVWEISSQPIVDRLVTFFMDRWEQANRPHMGFVPRGLNQREQGIIALLAVGDTDAVVADKLGISVRTIAYTLKELMERHGVRNRFQLGLVLGAQSVQTPQPTQEDQ